MIGYMYMPYNICNTSIIEFSNNKDEIKKQKYIGNKELEEETIPIKIIKEFLSNNSNQKVIEYKSSSITKNNINLNMEDKKMEECMGEQKPTIINLIENINSTIATIKTSSITSAEMLNKIQYYNVYDEYLETHKKSAECKEDKDKRTIIEELMLIKLKLIELNQLTYSNTVFLHDIIG